ncbi:hypothetical protein [Agromyces bauzanensis]|uniref:hypothetical protein n=1 Tax=Agromyces bauzanensis TaxID=1308924 RepID=UPI001665BF14|nr:hypothetical protein [Agromyces bauzanensis]
MNDPSVELFDGELPEIRAVINELRQRVTKVRILRTCLELDQDDVSRRGKAEQIDVARARAVSRPTTSRSPSKPRSSAGMSCGCDFMISCRWCSFGAGTSTRSKVLSFRWTNTRRGTTPPQNQEQASVRPARPLGSPNSRVRSIGRATALEASHDDLDEVGITVRDGNLSTGLAGGSPNQGSLGVGAVGEVGVSQMAEVLARHFPRLTRALALRKWKSM